MFTLTAADEHSQDWFIGMRTTELPTDEWNRFLPINDHKMVSFKINIGAQAKVMSVKLYNTLRAKPLHSLSINNLFSRKHASRW